MGYGVAPPPTLDLSQIQLCHGLTSEGLCSLGGYSCSLWLQSKVCDHTPGEDGLSRATKGNVLTSRAP